MPADPVLALTVVLTVLAAALHGYVFVLESLRWEDPATRRVFRTTEESARVTAPLAYNQGFYNLFLAVGAVAGAVALPLDRAVGAALVVLSLGSMLAAALVLITSDRTLARAAVVQGTLPALGLLSLLVASV